ncbi:hypothetical protein BDQ17DRAFT_244476 [Cyathus striatus]|nr:hypothetical protein BDQ17DRAFT_244476 [Cyathus striatus]
MSTRTNIPLHDPHDTVVRKVFLYPVDDTEPRFDEMEFSVEGAKRPHGTYTTALDLRKTYGKSIHGTRTSIFQRSVEGGGEYVLHFNIDIRVPINLSIARILGIDPKRPGPRLMFRGDVIVIKEDFWPLPYPKNVGPHMNYLNMDASFINMSNDFIMKAYYSDYWTNFMEEEEMYQKTLSPHLNFGQGALMPLMLSNPQMDDSEYKRMLKNDAHRQRMLNRLKKYSERQLALDQDICGHCNVKGNASLKFVAGAVRSNTIPRNVRRATGNSTKVIANTTKRKNWKLKRISTRMQIMIIYGKAQSLYGPSTTHGGPSEEVFH